jgi:predicted transcriptional regulator YdeE
MKKRKMEKYSLQNDLEVFGKQVTTFPNGIGEAFNELVQILGGFSRSYYGISYMDGHGKMVYYATAEEKQPGEAEKHSCESLTIEKGEYLAITVTDWRRKTDTIKDVFHVIIEDARADKTKPATEWYKNDREMMCMVKTTNSN